ncbi:MAG: GerMN domain-containing protein [Candidatus Peregrinibacteria bacterium]|nr:GerMN domain-containing protein [Candidatus Peregrinibacteria bacterium]
MKKQLKQICIVFVGALIFVGCNSSKPSTAMTPDPKPVEEKVVQAATPEPKAEAATTQANMVVKVYFNNPKIDPNWDFECSNVLAVERTIPKTESVASAAIAELLKGPTDAEKSKGYMSNINTGVKVQGISIKDGIAKIDFNEQLQFQVGGSCKISAIYAQIKQTLKQFSSVKDVVISINGQTENILQP